MSYYQPLSSEKYYHDAVRQEIKELRREKNREAVQSFMHFLFALAVFMLTVTAFQQMPAWLPTITAFFEQNGISDAIQAWANQLK